MTNDKAYEGDGLGNLPSHALYRGKKVRLFWYEKGATRPFHILDHNDHKRTVTRQDLTFLPRKKKKIT